MFRVGIITCSDKGYAGEREDESGNIIKKILENKGYLIEKYLILPDDEETLSKELIFMSDILKVNLIITTGGTGFSKRDVTPEATKKVIFKETPGISEAIRYNSLKFTPRAMLSRGVSGIRNDTLIINLPGSSKAVKECLEYIIDPLNHGVEILLGLTNNCGGK